MTQAKKEERDKPSMVIAIFASIEQEIQDLEDHWSNFRIFQLICLCFSYKFQGGGRRNKIGEERIHLNKMLSLMHICLCA